MMPVVAYADAAAEMARKLQNPLANIKALMTDNAVGFDTGEDEGTSYGFSEGYHASHYQSETCPGR